MLDRNGDRSVHLFIYCYFRTPGLTRKRRLSMFYYTFSIICTKAMERGAASQQNIVPRKSHPTKR
jgi:hypothetical protein